MRNLRNRYGPWAIVTGASSGMGAAFARHLAVAGINLVLVARREDRLRALSHRLRDETGVEVRVVGVDLSRPDSLSVIEATTDDIEVGLVVNNAGGAAFGPFMEGDISAELRRVNVNVIAPMRLARTYGPAMRKRRRGGIIFLSSIVASAGTPRWSAYAASKAATSIFAEGLAAELAGDGVDVLSVTPGPTQTEFMELSRVGRAMSLTAYQVARGALSHLGRRRSWTPGFLNKAIRFSTRLLPRPVSTSIFGRVVTLIHASDARTPVARMKSSHVMPRSGDQQGMLPAALENPDLTFTAYQSAVRHSAKETDIRAEWKETR